MAGKADLDMEQLGATIGAAITDGIAAIAPPKEIGYGHPEYQARLKQEGVFDEFVVPVYQNGKPAQARGLKPETLQGVGALRPGVYQVLGGKVEVALDQKGRVHLFYPHAKVEDRMRFSPDFDALVAALLAAQGPAITH